MSILAIRSIPLSRETQSAWRSINTSFLRRSRNPDEYIRFANSYDHIINLGNSHVSEDHEKLWNKRETVSVLISPSKTREVLGEYLPPQNSSPQGFWIKHAGRAGRGKVHYSDDHYGAFPTPEGADLQAHIEGQEYRINTVGSLVIQCHYRRGPDGQRSYEWVRIRDVPTNLKEIVRRATRTLPSGDRSILAWDTIWNPSERQAYILEGNTCPGLNEATAQRILRQLGE